MGKFALMLKKEQEAGDALRRKLLHGILEDMTGGLVYGIGRSDNPIKRSLFKWEIPKNQFGSWGWNYL